MTQTTTDTATRALPPSPHGDAALYDGAAGGFAAGTLIHTQDGLLPVQDLLPGDLILTADHGFRPLRRIKRRCVAGLGPAAPVLISAGTFGNSRDLWVNPHHHILLSGRRARALFGAAEVLAAALHLVNGSAIRLQPCPRIDYIRLIFDRAELIFSESILTESHRSAGRTARPRATPHDLRLMLPDLAGSITALSTPGRTDWLSAR